MFVKFLACDDDRIPGGPSTKITTLPSLEIIENSVLALDAKLVRLVVIAEGPPGDESYFPYNGNGMMIGGGGENRHYYCQLGIDDETSYSLISLENATLEPQPIVFGQLAYYPGIYCVDVEKVIIAVREFFQTGQLHPSLAWKKDAF